MAELILLGNLKGTDGAAPTDATVAPIITAGDETKAALDTTNADLVADGATAMAAAVAAKIAAVVDKSGATNGQVATYDSATGKYKPAAPSGGSATASYSYLDAYNMFFGGSVNAFVTGQSVTATTTTSAVTPSATVLPLTSVTGMLAGQVLILNGATANQQFVRVVSIAANNVTITPAVNAAGVANGGQVAPLWVGSAHLTSYGYNAFAYFIARHTALNNAAGKKITLLGDSWFQGNTQYATQLTARFPSATVVNVGIAGNTSTNLLARFDTDVPADSNYVIINEPGVNDVLQNFSATLVAQNLSALIGKILAIGAIPIITGMVPLSDNVALSTARSAQMVAQTSGLPTAGALAVFTDGWANTNVGFGPGVQQSEPTGTKNTGMGSGTQTALTTGTGNTGIGNGAQGALTSGTGNTGLGDRAQRLLTTAIGATGVGQQAQQALTTGGGDTAVGYQAQFNVTTGADDTTVGAQASLSLTTGGSNTHVGRSAGYTPNGLTANATTTASRQTLVGHNTGQNSATQVNDITAVGYNARGGATKGTALGSGAVADHTGSVALGSDTFTTAAAQVMMGPRHVAITEVTDPGVAAADGARLFAMDNGSGKTQLAVRFQSGASIVLATEV